jgi:hypothetical protein
MKKSLIILILTFFSLAAGGNAFCEEMAKEGTTTGKNFVSGTSTVLPMGEERLQINYEGSGVSINDSGKGFLNNSAVYCVGSIQAVKGAIKETGFMVFTSQDGDKVYLTYKSSGKFGEPHKGTSTFTGGTGKYEGVQGNGEFTLYNLHNAKEGVWTAKSIWKNSYKLP